MRSVNYNYRELSWKDLIRLIDDIIHETNYEAELGQIRPFRNRPAFKDLFGPKFKEFQSTFVNYQGEIRKYQININGARVIKNDTRMVLTVRIKENKDQTDPSYHYPSIELLQFQGEDYDFRSMKNLLEKKLSLTFSERQHKDDLLVRYNAVVKHDELRRRTGPSMNSHHYDQAIAAAAILVESALRDSCIKAGCVDASLATGVDLAKYAYHSENGCLNPPYAIAAQANHGAFLMFQGFFMYIRNTYLHNATVMGGDRQYVIELLELCESLIHIAEGSTPR